MLKMLVTTECMSWGGRGSCWTVIFKFFYLEFKLLSEQSYPFENISF